MSHSQQIGSECVHTQEKEIARIHNGQELHSEVVSHSPEEVQGFFKWLRNWHDPIFFHIAFWQLTSHRQRISEILSIEWADIDWQKEIVWINGTMVHRDENGKTPRNFKQYGTKEGRTGIPIFFGGENTHLKASLNKAP